MEAVPGFLSRDDCLKVLARKVPSAQLIGFEIAKLSDETLGFLGDHFRLIIEYRSGDAANRPATQNTSFFVKTLPQSNSTQNDYVKAMGVFRKESLVYQNLIAEMSKLCEFPFAPHCYYVRPFDCIVLEDLGRKGFGICRGDYLDVEHCAALMKTLGRFHASSVVFEQRKSVRIDDKFGEEVREGSYSFTPGHPRYDWCRTVTKCVADLIKLSSPSAGKRDEQAEKFEKYVFETLPDWLRPSQKFRNVLTHDDPWNNNLMFGPNLDDCVLVDFQLVRYAPPAFDFLVAFHLNCEDKSHLYRFVDIYFGCFAKELRRHGLDAADVLPKREFLASLEAYKVPALVECAMYGTNVLISKELSDEIVSTVEKFKEFAYVDRGKYICKEYKDNKAFRNRYDNVLLPLVEALSN